jgi:hypothetical protein
MKSSSSKYRGGFTGWDLLVVLVTVSLAVIVLPAFLCRARVSCGRSRCISNGWQIGLAFRLWSGDHQEKFPMRVSTNEGGSLEFLGSNDVFKHFLVISNQLNNPKVLTCPKDQDRRFPTNFATLNNGNLSYFVGLDADETIPQMILSGDRNLSTNGRFMSGILTLTSNSTISWTKEIHVHRGNLGLADGSAQQTTDSGLLNQIHANTDLPADLVPRGPRLAIP